MGRPNYVLLQCRHPFKMASTISKVCLRGSHLLKNTQAIAGSTRTLSVSASLGKNRVGPDSIEHATGIEKWELMAAQAGKDDPFVVDAMDTYRMVGCVCEEHDCHIKWMWLIEGRDKRCACGHYFTLKHNPAPDRYNLPN